jgi:hypothetical protein
VRDVGGQVATQSPARTSIEVKRAALLALIVLAIGSYGRFVGTGRAVRPAPTTAAARAVPVVTAPSQTAILRPLVAR